jgi:hypothetical protein
MFYQHNEDFSAVWMWQETTEKDIENARKYITMFLYVF